MQISAVDISFNFAVPGLLFIRLPKWYALMRFNTPEQIIAGLQDADTRATLVAEAQGMMSLWNRLVLRQVQSDASRST